MKQNEEKNKNRAKAKNNDSQKTVNINGLGYPKNLYLPNDPDEVTIKEYKSMLDTQKNIYH